MATIETALVLVATKQNGQKDIGGEPYVLHVLRVMAGVKTLPEKIVAILHDVVEDTETTLDDLLKLGFDRAIVIAVDCLTKRKGEDRVSAAHRAAANRLACAVKLADLADNMNMTRIPNPTARDYARLEEYKKAKAILEDARDMRWNGFAA